MSGSSIDSTAVKRRRSGAEVRDRVAVRTAVADVAGRFHSLQNEVAFLNAALARTANPDDLLERTATLQQQVEDLFELLDASLAALEPRQRDHGRVQDLRRALEHLSSALPKPAARSTTQ